MDLGSGDLALRVGLTVVFCGAIGLEREARDQVAGLRTHILVGLGAALFTLVSAYGFTEFPRAGEGGQPGYDPTRIAAQVVSGIGFLGAGAIIRQGFNVRGVTTAAALWISAAVGMALAAGYYEGAIACTIAALVALALFRRVRPYFLRRVRRDFSVAELRLESGRALGEVYGELHERGVQVRAMETEEDQVSFELRLPAGLEERGLVDVLSRIDGVQGVRIARVRDE
jgi:putative Mg2+ transporter-C (MgtC) family protein